LTTFSLDEGGGGGGGGTCFPPNKASIFPPLVRMAHGPLSSRYLAEVFGQPDTFIGTRSFWYYYNKMQGNSARFASKYPPTSYWALPKEVIFLFQINSASCGLKQSGPNQKTGVNKEPERCKNANDEKPATVIYIENGEKPNDDVWRSRCFQPADKRKNVAMPNAEPEEPA